MNETLPYTSDDTINPIAETLSILSDVRTARNELARRSTEAKDRLFQAQTEYKRLAGFEAIDLLISRGPLGNIRTGLSQQETDIVEAEHDIRFLGYAGEQMKAHCAERDKEIASFLGGRVLRATIIDKTRHYQIRKVIKNRGTESSPDFPRQITAPFVRSDAYAGVLILDSLTENEQWGIEVFDPHYLKEMDQKVELGFM